VANLAGQPASTAIEAAVDDEATADASAKRGMKDVAGAAAGAKAELAKGGRAGIVFDVDGDAERLGDGPGEMDVAKAFDVGREEDGTRIRINEARSGDAGGRRGGSGGAGDLPKECAQQLDDFRTFRWGRAFPAGENVALIVYKGSAKVRPAEICRHHNAFHALHCTASPVASQRGCCKLKRDRPLR